MPRIEKEVVGPHIVSEYVCDLPDCITVIEGVSGPGYIAIEYTWWPNGQRQYLQFCGPPHAADYFAALGG